VAAVAHPDDDVRDAHPDREPPLDDDVAPVLLLLLDG
jgi:hypothetical protein